jgi:hypothetical protein
MQIIPNYASLQGQIFLYEQDANRNPLTGFWVGDASALEFLTTENTTDYKENWSGKRSTALTLTNELITGVNWTMLQFNTKLLEVFYRGENVTQDTTPVVDLVITGTTLTDGDRFSLRADNVTAVSIKDSTSTPVTLVLDTDYELDPVTGVGRILDASGLTGPLKASFTPGATDYVKLLSGTKKEFWLEFVGVNTAVSGEPKGKLVLYRYQPNFPASLPLINDGRAEPALTGAVYADANRPASGALGQFGRIHGFGLA